MNPISTFKPTCAIPETVVRPVGNYRFLNPFDTVQVGDLVRVMITDNAEDSDVYEANWTTIHGGFRLVGESYDPDLGLEIIRGIDNESTVVELFPTQEAKDEDVEN